MDNYYIHNLDPFLIKFSENFGIRWYGVAYLLTFLSAYLILHKLIKSRYLICKPEILENIITGTALFGVLGGGRLGYCLFYQFSTLLSDPLYLFRVWEGGMSSHGGLIGVIVSMIFFSRYYKISFWNLADSLALATPVGFFLGRAANFINGELVGRPSTSPWAVIFPDYDKLPRHPSQIYAAFFEGALIMFILWFCKNRFKKQRGILSCLFLILYGLARIFTELFREPDSTIYFNYITKGQLYSFFMIFAGIILLSILRKNKFFTE